MKQPQLINTLLDQSKHPVWIINLNYQLIYANSAYQEFIKGSTGKHRKLHESIFDESDTKVHLKKWKAHYSRAFKGEHFEIEEQFIDRASNKTHYSQITFEPLIGDDGDIFAVSCRSKDISDTINQRSEVKQLIDSSLDVFCTIDKTGNFVHVSAASSSLWGYAPDELVGKNYQGFVLEEDIAKTEKAAKSILSGQHTKSFTNRYRKKDGGIAYNLWSVRWDESTKLHYSVARDGQEKIEQEEKLARSEQRFKALVQGGSDLYAIIDLQGRYTYMSPSSTAITGIPPEAFVGRDAFEFIHPDDIEQTQSSLKKISTVGKVVMEPYRAKNQHNEWRWVETVLTNMLDNPAVNGIVVNSRDITKEVEEKRQLKLLESVITNTKDAVLITEAEQLDEPGPKIIYVNEAFTKMTGYEAEEIIGKSPRILQGPNSNKEELAKLGLALRNGQPYEVTTINYKKSGEEFWVNFTVNPVANEKGRYTHMIAIERDVTEQKNRELEKNLIDTISNIFQESVDNDLTACFSSLCEHITQFGDFDLAEVWLPSIDANNINRVANYSKGKAGSKFYQATKQITSSALGEGLPGFVWKNKKTEIWGNVEGQWLPKRKLAIKKAGFESMMGVPLLHKGEVNGVLLLGTLKTKSALTQYVDVLKKLELAIGNELSRKKVEIELAQIFDFTPDLICTAGFDGYIKRMNPAGLAMLGYSLDEIRSRPINSFILEQDQSMTEDRRKKLHKGENLQNFENRYVTKQGKIIWLSWTATPSPEQGVVYAVAKNITEEKNLRELNREVGELAKIGSWEFDTVNNTIFWSDEVHKIYGTDPRTFVPTMDAAINFYREDYRDLALSSFEECIATQQPYSIEAVVVNSDKKEVWVQTTAKAEYIDGVCCRVYGSFQNIDDRKQSEIRLQSFSENLPGVVYQYIIHPDGTDSMQFISGMVEKLWGYTTNEVMENIDLLWDQIKLGGDIEEVKSSIAKSIETKSKWSCRFKIVNHTGEIKTHLGSGTPIFLVDGTILFHVMVLDITQEAKNEELLEEITNLARIGVWEIDLKNEKVYWSSMVHQLHETDPLMHVPTIESGIDFYREDFQELVKRSIDNSIKSGLPFDFEAVLVTKEENEIWVRSTGTAEVSDGVCTRIYGSFQDIHQRKTASLALEKSLKTLEDYKYALDQSAIIAITDNKGIITSVNDNFCEISKYERGEIIGKTHQLINSKHHSKEFFKDLWKTISSGEVWRGEIKNKTKIGTYYWVDTTIVPFLDERNKPIQYLAIRFDITERKKAEKENKFKANLLSTVGQAAIATDLDGIVNYWNNAAEQIYGWKREEALGKDIMYLTTPDDNKIKVEEIMQVLKKGQTWLGEFEVKRKDGTSFLAMISNSPIYNEQNQLSGMIGISTDISEKVKNERLLEQYTLELERSNEELEQFAFVASHDLQEPLRMISSFMELLKLKYGDKLDEKALQYIYFATDGAKRMKQIILDLLDYSRANKHTGGKEDVNMNEILSEFEQLRRKLIIEKLATIESDSLPTLHTYRAAIVQILHCLIDNALKYTFENTPPVIEIRAVEKTDEWQFSIKDNGIGIEPQFYEKIFIIFQRLHNRDQYTGTGIGLSIAKRHVEFLGGKIWLESTPGHGTTFYFTISKKQSND